MDSSWYVLRSHPHKEEALYRQLQLQGFEAFFPALRVNPVNPRSRKIRPYFPGYLFVHVDIKENGFSVFQWMPHAVGLVSFGGEPATVPQPMITTIQHRLQEIAAAGGEVLEGLKAGDEVIVQDGPFAGYEAIFDLRLAGNERVRVLLKMLSDRSVPLELRAGQIQAKKKQKPGP